MEGLLLFSRIVGGGVEGEGDAGGAGEEVLFVGEGGVGGLLVGGG